MDEYCSLCGYPFSGLVLNHLFNCLDTLRRDQEDLLTKLSKTKGKILEAENRIALLGRDRR